MITLLLLPLLVSLWITAHINLLASGSIPVDGSSNKTIGGLHIIEIATDNFLLFPPDNLPANLFVYLVNVIDSIIALIISLNLSGSTPFILE